MKIKAEFSASSIGTDEIDLVDYGYNEDDRFEDLTEAQKIEIMDALRAEVYVMVSVRTIEE